MKTKQEWIKELTKERHVSVTYQAIINQKKHKVSYFYQYASEEHRQDKELNILNFAQNKNLIEVPPEMIDFDFLQGVFKINEATAFFQLPYHWTNTPDEKKFLIKAINIISRRSLDNRNSDIKWTFEPGFWSDLTYTQQIKEKNYYHLELAIVQELNRSQAPKEIDYLVKIVNEVPYYLKHLTSKNKNLLPIDTILSYVRDYGLNGLTHAQKNRYDIVKEAFQHNQLNYDKLDYKWKTKETLRDFLHHELIWQNGSMHVNQLNPELLKDRELIKACLINGDNLLDIKTLELTNSNTLNNTHWFQDKELKSIALKTCADYKIIEDCLDDKEMVLDFLNNINTKNNRFYSGINLFEQTKRISEAMYQNKNVMEAFLAVTNLNEKEFIPGNAVKALNNYTIEDLIDLITINKEVYQVLNTDMKNKWELILPYYRNSKNDYNGFSSDISDIIVNSGSNYTEKLLEIEKYALNEKLSKNLEPKHFKDDIKKIKI